MNELSNVPLFAWIIISVVGQLIGLITIIWKDSSARRDREQQHVWEKEDRNNMLKDIKVNVDGKHQETQSLILDNTQKTMEAAVSAKEALGEANDTNLKISRTNEQIAILQQQLNKMMAGRGNK